MMPAWKVYLGSVVFLLPTLFAWTFCMVFLAPTLEEIWQRAGVANSRTKVLEDVWSLFINYGRLELVALVLIVITLEMFLPAWSRNRAMAMTIIVFLINVFVLLVLLTFCTMTGAAARSIIKS